MNTHDFNDVDAYAHDLYEYHLYETLRAKHPHLTPEEVAGGVLEIIGWVASGETE